jgi:hypothetical protein
MLATIGIVLLQEPVQHFQTTRDLLLKSTTHRHFLVLLLHLGNESHLEQQQSKLLNTDWSKRTSPMAPHWIAKAGNPSRFLLSQILSMIELAMP